MATRCIVLFIAVFTFSKVFASTGEQIALNDPGETKDMVFLLVDKSKLRADLRTWPTSSAESQLLMSFRIAIGKSEGDKQEEGDNRTPEGIYFTQSIIDGSTLPAKYGPKAIPINFPNHFDKMDGKTGHGIWLHGVEEDTRVEAAKVTEGCVAFYNADILTLTRWLQPHQAVVVIAKDGVTANRPEDIQQVQQATHNWWQAWKKRNLENYISYYAKRFFHNGLNLAGYKTYKSRVFRSYKQMEVAIQDTRVFTHQKYALTVMNQDFNGDNRYVSQGRKILYWERDDQDNWQIAREVFEQRRLDFLHFSSADVAQTFADSPSAKVFLPEKPRASNL